MNNSKQKTYQEQLSNQEIKEKLKDYKKVTDIRSVNIGTHIRYFSKDNKFRLGGLLNTIDPELRYIKLANGQKSWSVQIPGAQFFQKMSSSEIKEEMKQELKKEILSESELMNNKSKNNIELENTIKNLTKKIESYKNIEKSYNTLLDENTKLKKQIEKIKVEIKKEKQSKKI
jgi:hypothetical protein